VKPSPWIERFGASVPTTARVCDVACGGGRHTRWFAERGHHVVAIDRDLSGVTELGDTDFTEGLHVELVEADLEDGTPPPIPSRAFGVVVVTNYLWRPILDAVVDGVAAGGMLLYETFAVGNERFGRPTNPDFLLRRNELLGVALAHGLVVLAFEDVEVETPKPAVVQRIAAVRLTGDAATTTR
jgi:SAM-dependent methyltransferase